MSVTLSPVSLGPMRVPALDERPLIAHVVFSFDYGGLENGVANLINGLPDDAFRHAVVSLTTTSNFLRRIRKTDVSSYSLQKRPGKDPGAYLRLFHVLKQLRPAIVHTRNLSTLEGALVARLAGVPRRIHGEHGWDVFDPDGTSRKYRLLRRLMSPSIDQFVTVSEELERWVTTTIGVPSTKVTRICNGVDTTVFRPATERVKRVLPRDRFREDSIVIGTVTRFSAIKDPLNLVRAFIEARRDPIGPRLRLVMVGAGALREEALGELEAGGAARAAWLPGSRDDIAEILREIDVFVLGSRREGVSNTVLEAMATGLPVIATATGGNLELIEGGTTGELVRPGDYRALAHGMLAYAHNTQMRLRHGEVARRRVEAHYSLHRMLADYDALYRAHCDVRQEVA